MRFDRVTLRKPWMRHVSDWEVFRKMETKQKLIIRIRKRQLTFLVRKEVSENLTLKWT